MEYKIVFSDIDGTLLNKDRELSNLTRKVFKALQLKVPIVLISSRMPQAMRHLQQDLGIAHQPLICYNGALILLDGAVKSSKEIPLGILQDLVDFNKDIGCHLSLYNNEDWYVPDLDQWARREQHNTKVTPVVKPAEEVLLLWRDNQCGPQKIMCMGEETKIDRISKFLSEHFRNELHLYRSKPTYLEVADKNISKLTAIEVLLDEHFHLSLKESIAFGDNFNDYEMLQAAGMGIAVGNAKPEILEIAKEITDHGKQDGVAKSLQRIFNLE